LLSGEGEKRCEKAKVYTESTIRDRGRAGAMGEKKAAKEEKEPASEPKL